jgi:hypothetical protein
LHIVQNPVVPQQPLEYSNGDIEPASPAEADYEFFCTTVMATARGRSFLAEYVRRHRSADTQAVLAALRRIETMVRGAPTATPLDHIQDGLRELAAIVRATRSDLGADRGGLSAANKVMALLDLLETRIAAMIAPPADEAPAPVAAAVELRPERAHLTVVPPPVVVLSPSAALLPSLGPADAAVPLVVVAAKPPVALQVLPRSAPQPPATPIEAPPRDALFADVMALSEAERIALFS